MQIGETVNLAAREIKPNKNIKTINNNKEAVEHYKTGKGKPVWLSDNILSAAKNNEKQQDKLQNRILSGATTAAQGNYGIKLNGNWLIGKNSAFDDNGYFFCW